MFSFNILWMSSGLATGIQGKDCESHFPWLVSDAFFEIKYPGERFVWAMDRTRVSRVKGVGITRYTVISAIYRIVKVIDPIISTRPLFTLRFETIDGQGEALTSINWFNAIARYHIINLACYHLPLFDLKYKRWLSLFLSPRFVHYYHRYFVETKRFVERNDQRRAASDNSAARVDAIN